MDVGFKLLLKYHGNTVISKGKYELLREVEKRGSLNSASKFLGLSYKKAFSYIKSIEESLGEKVLLRTPGKASVLSKKGYELIDMYDFFYNELSVFIENKKKDYEKR